MFSQSCWSCVLPVAYISASSFYSFSVVYTTGFCSLARSTIFPFGTVDGVQVLPSLVATLESNFCDGSGVVNRMLPAAERLARGTCCLGLSCSTASASASLSVFLFLSMDAVGSLAALPCAAPQLGTARISHLLSIHVNVNVSDLDSFRFAGGELSGSWLWGYVGYSSGRRHVSGSEHVCSTACWSSIHGKMVSGFILTLKSTD